MDYGFNFSMTQEEAQLLKEYLHQKLDEDKDRKGYCSEKITVIYGRLKDQIDDGYVE